MKRTDYITIITVIEKGQRSTIIDGAFSTKEKAEGWADSTYLDDKWIEKREIEPSDSEAINQNAFRYFETEKGDQCWIWIAPMEVD